MLTLGHTLRDGDPDRAFLQHHMAACIKFRGAQREVARSALIGLFQVDHDLGVMILSRRPELTLRAHIGRGPAAAREKLVKERPEVIGIGFGIATAGKLETFIPIGWRAKRLPLFPVGAQLIIGGALFGILQNFIGFAHILEGLFCVSPGIHIRVILAQQFAIGALDLVLRCRPLDTQNLVIILVVHFSIDPRAAPNRKPVMKAPFQSTSISDPSNHSCTGHSRPQT
jgi:hypothetical protein